MDDYPVDSADASAQDLLAECLELSRSEWSQAVRDACKSRPDLAGPLDRLFRNVCAIDAALYGPEVVKDVAVRGPGCGSIIGDYELIERVGGGGMGVVYRAKQRSLNRTVALKLIRPEVMLVQKAKDRFRRETEAIARLHHPGIVPLFEAGEDGAVPYFTMEFIEGQSVANVLNGLRFRDTKRLRAIDFATAYRQGSPRLTAVPDEGIFSLLDQKSWPSLCCRIVARVARALQHAHDNGVVHRDVKPSNLMVTDSGRVIVVDFGLAVTEGAPALTRSGSQPGSLPYMAPEQLAGRIADARTDIYSLGVTLYELLTLRCPFPLTNESLARKNIATGIFDRPRARNSAITPEIEAVCLKAMDRDPTARYASAAAFADDLVNAVLHRPLQAKTFGWGRRMTSSIRRNPARAIMWTSIVLACVVSPTGFAVFHRSHASELEFQVSKGAALGSAADSARAEVEALAELLGQLLTGDNDGGFAPLGSLETAVISHTSLAADRLAAYPVSLARYFLAVSGMHGRQRSEQEALRYAKEGLRVLGTEAERAAFVAVPLLCTVARVSPPSEGVIAARRAVALAEQTLVNQNYFLCISNYALAHELFMLEEVRAAEEAIRLAISRAELEEATARSDQRLSARWQQRIVECRSLLATILLMAGRAAEARRHALTVWEWALIDPAKRLDELVDSAGVLIDLDSGSPSGMPLFWATEALRRAQQLRDPGDLLVLQARLFHLSALMSTSATLPAPEDVDKLVGQIKHYVGDRNTCYHLARTRQATFLCRIGHFTEARDLLTELLHASVVDAIGENSALVFDVRIARSSALLALGDRPGALADDLVAKGVATASSSCLRKGMAAIQMSRCLDNVEDCASVIADLCSASKESAVEVGSSHVSVITMRVALGALLSRTAQLAEAEQVLNQVVESVEQLPKESQSSKAWPLLELGEINFARGRLGEARRVWEEGSEVRLGYGNHDKDVRQFEVRTRLIAVLMSQRIWTSRHGDDLGDVAQWVNQPGSCPESVLLNALVRKAVGGESSTLSGLRTLLRQVQVPSHHAVRTACYHTMFAHAACSEGDWAQGEEAARVALVFLRSMRCTVDWLIALNEVVIARCTAQSGAPEGIATKLAHLGAVAAKNDGEGWQLVEEQARTALDDLKNL